MSKAIQFIGTQRSGSNLLRLILNQHPSISAPHPPHLLKTFIPLLPFYKEMNGQAMENLVDEMCRWVEANPVEWTNVNFDRSSILENSDTIFEVFKHIYQAKAEADEADIWCCKSTFNIHYSDELEEKVKPFYIHLYRDGRDVAASFKRVMVGHKHAFHLAHQWQKEQELAIDLLNKVEEQRKYSVSYEKLLDQPEAVAKEICLKLGIEYDEKMLLYYQSEESQHTAESGRMWASVTSPILKDNTGKYRRELTPEDIEIFEEIAGGMLENLGYTLDKPTTGKIVWDEEEFERLNSEMVKERINSASRSDIQKREAQKQLLQQIRSRLAINV